MKKTLNRLKASRRNLSLMLLADMITNLKQIKHKDFNLQLKKLLMNRGRHKKSKEKEFNTQAEILDTIQFYRYR